MGGQVCFRWLQRITFVWKASSEIDTENLCGYGELPASFIAATLALRFSKYLLGSSSSSSSDAFFAPPPAGAAAAFAASFAAFAASFSACFFCRFCSLQSRAADPEWVAHKR